MTLTRFFVITCLSLFLSGCKFANYSFSGTSIPIDVNTISITTFPIQGQNAAIAPATLSQNFTEALRDIFIQQSRLELVRNNGDLIIEGEIIGYTVRNAAVSNNQAATENLIITVKVKYIDNKHPENSYEQKFSQMEPYSAGTNLSDVEPTIIPIITERITQDIFNKSLGNW
jgi:hypothetical protein